MYVLFILFRSPKTHVKIHFIEQKVALCPDAKKLDSVKSDIKHTVYALQGNERICSWAFGIIYDRCSYMIECN